MSGRGGGYHSQHTESVHDRQERNFSFAHGSSDYLMWLDADDVLLPADAAGKGERHRNDRRTHAQGEGQRPHAADVAAIVRRRDQRYLLVGRDIASTERQTRLSTPHLSR